MQRETKLSKTLVIPVLLDSCRIQDLVADKRYADFSEQLRLWAK